MPIDFRADLSMVYQRHYRDLVKSKYNKVLLGNITMCDVYQINQDSVFNKDSDSYYENIGSKSPLRFTKIRNYPLFNVQAGSYTIDWGLENGIRSDSVTIEVTVAPFSITPSIGSFIKLHNEQYTGLFKVTPQQEDSTMDPGSHKRVTLELTRFLLRDVEKQTTGKQVWLFNKDYSVDENEYQIASQLSQHLGKLIEPVVRNNFDYKERTLLGEEYTNFLRDYITGLSVIPSSVTPYNPLRDLKPLTHLVLSANENGVKTFSNGSDIELVLNAMGDDSDELVYLLNVPSDEPLRPTAIALLEEVGVLDTEEEQVTMLLEDGDDDTIPWIPLEPNVDPDEEDIPLTPIEPGNRLEYIPKYSNLPVSKKSSTYSFISKQLGYDITESMIYLSQMLIEVMTSSDVKDEDKILFSVNTMSLLSKYFDIKVVIDTYIGKVHYKTI